MAGPPGTLPASAAASALLQTPPAVGEQPQEGEIVVAAILQETEGPWRRLRGAASLETQDYLLKADEIDWNEESGYAEARGSVYFKNHLRGEELWADKVEYDLNAQTGKFHRVRGYSQVKFDPRPGLLRTQNPMYFQGSWAEKLKDRYILHDGLLTNCDPAHPWWTLRAPKFDVIPGDRALVYRSVLRIRKIPVLYAPVFYKSLKEEDRHSGFLTPTVGNSSRRGLMVGTGYYWAIARSYDASYRAQYFSLRGFAHQADFRAKPTRTSSLNVFVYGVNDRGRVLEDGSRVKEGGYILSASGQASLPGGWFARGHFNHLSSFLFRQSFTETFTEAVFSEVTSTAWLQKLWGPNSFYALFSRVDNFQSTKPDDKISLRKLPQVEWHRSEARIVKNGPPVYFSWDLTGGLVRRTQPLFQTRQYVDRIDIQPRLTMPFHWKGFVLTPSVSLRETRYGSSLRRGDIVGENLRRGSREFSAELVLPPIARIYNLSAPLFGERVKHVVESRLRYRRVAGVDSFDQVIRFDDIDLWSDTDELEYSLVNRLFGKAKNGEVKDVLSWELRQKRFFDPTFGGAVTEGRRNVLTSSLETTAFAFLDRPRRYSPVASLLRSEPFGRIGFEWRSDYDPLRGSFVSQGITTDARMNALFVSLGYTKVQCVDIRRLDGGEDPCRRKDPPPGTVLSPPANQFRGLLVVGDENRRGWNAAFQAIYDFRTSVMQFANSQVTYNTECCAFSFQYRRFGFGIRNENQFRFSLVIANIGAFGTLKRQERLF